MGKDGNTDLQDEGRSGTGQTDGRQQSDSLRIVPGVEKQADSSLSDRSSRPRKKELSTGEYVQGILSGDRVILGRTITLIESLRPDDNNRALEVIEKLLPHTGNSIRVGITGVPGVGKSTFIETLGAILTSRGHKLAVLAIDPSSEVSGGSIMGDKTRMETLSVDLNAFIRPSPSAGSLGGVARKTREAMLICEAAGYDIIFIETVGVGQSETLVHSMVDFFLLLMLAGAGDQLQGIKRGIMELADAVVINKADGDNLSHALAARQEYESAMHLLRPAVPGWTPAVLTCSALTGNGIEEVWDAVLSFHNSMKSSGRFRENRKHQAMSWMLETIRQSLYTCFEQHPEIEVLLPQLKKQVLEENLPPLTAAQQLLKTFFDRDVPSM